MLLASSKLCLDDECAAVTSPLVGAFDELLHPLQSQSFCYALCWLLEKGLFRGHVHSDISLAMFTVPTVEEADEQRLYPPCRMCPWAVPSSSSTPSEALLLFFWPLPSPVLSSSCCPYARPPPGLLQPLGACCSLVPHTRCWITSFPPILLCCCCEYVYENVP